MQKIRMHFINAEGLSSISDTDFDIQKNLKPLTEMYLDTSCSEIIKTLPSDVSNICLKNCRKFYITALENMRRRLLENDTLL